MFPPICFTNFFDEFYLVWSVEKKKKNCYKTVVFFHSLPVEKEIIAFVEKIRRFGIQDWWLVIDEFVKRANIRASQSNQNILPVVKVSLITQ